MNRRAFLQTSVTGIALSGLSTGCIGSFALTGKVLEFNRGLGGIVIQEVVFLAFVIVPVYSACVFIDAVVLNTIEAFTGSNPLAKGGTGESRHVAMADEVDYFVVPGEDSVETELVEGGQRKVRFFRRREDGIEVTDEQGAVVARARVDLVEGLIVEDIYGTELARVSVAQLEEGVHAFEQGGAGGLTELVMDGVSA